MIKYTVQWTICKKDGTKLIRIGFPCGVDCCPFPPSDLNTTFKMMEKYVSYNSNHSDRNCEVIEAE